MFSLTNPYLYMKNRFFHSLLTACCCLALLPAALNAQQSNVLAVAASAGGTGTLGGIEITWTLGEVAVSGDLVLDATNRVTVGFHQPLACAPATTALAQSICPGSSFQFGSQVLSAAGVYTDTLVAANGCDSIVTLTLGLHLPPTAQATTSDTLTCSKGQITLNSSSSSSGPGFVYQWTTTNGNILSGATTPMPTVDEGGDYQLIVKNVASGCADTAAVKVLETGEAILGISPITSDPSCAGLTDGAISVSVGQGGAAPLLYGLNGGALQGDASFAGLAAGTFSVRVQGTDGCEATQLVVLKAPAPLTVALAAPPGLLAAGASVTLAPTITGAQGALTFAWAGSSLSCTGCAAPSASPNFTSSYAVTVTDSEGCSATAAVTVDVDGNLGPDIITPGTTPGQNDELVFPELSVEPARSANDIVIFNRWGQVVYKAQPYRNEWNGVNQGGSNLPEGTYYYILTLRDGKKEVIHGSVLLIR